MSIPAVRRVWVSWASCAVGVFLEEVTFTLVLKDEEQFTGQRKCKGPSGKGIGRSQGPEASPAGCRVWPRQDRPDVLSRKLPHAQASQDPPATSLCPPRALPAARIPASSSCWLRLRSGQSRALGRGGLRHSSLSPIFPSAASKKQTAQLRKQSITLSQHFHFKDFLSKLLSGQMLPLISMRRTGRKIE